MFGSQPDPGTVPLAFCRLDQPDVRLAASQARDGHGGTPLHKAAGTANEQGVIELIGQGANVNARNNRGQAPVDVVAASNGRIKLLIERAGGRPSPTWDGTSGRRADAPRTRRQHQGASAARQERASTWREAQQSGSQPAKGKGKDKDQKGKGKQWP